MPQLLCGAMHATESTKRGLCARHTIATKLVLPQASCEAAKCTPHGGHMRGQHAAGQAPPQPLLSQLQLTRRPSPSGSTGRRASTAVEAPAHPVTELGWPGHGYLLGLFGASTLAAICDFKASGWPPYVAAGARSRLFRGDSERRAEGVCPAEQRPAGGGRLLAAMWRRLLAVDVRVWRLHRRAGHA